VATGVDRVELAYLERFLAELEPVFGLVRTAFGYVLLDRDGLQGLLDRIQGRVGWGPVDRLSRVALRLEPMQRRAQADVRRLAAARAPRYRLRQMLVQYLPQGVAYVNVGHTNLTDRVIDALRNGPKARVAVMIHDTIPLDYPEFQRPESVTRFKGLLRRTRAWTDVVLYNSTQTQTNAERHMAQWGPVPRGVVAHLGVEMITPDAAALPAGLVPDAPYFVSVGTIEPRKNHALLLDVWEQLENEMGADAPHLFICGARGWKNEEIFRRLDALKHRESHVHEVASLADPAMMALVQGAAGALFPSLAEGFGLPPLEAAALGVPVICADLAVYQEFLGDIPVYVGPMERYLWLGKIKDLAEDQRAGKAATRRDKPIIELPNWNTHFNVVLKVT